MGDYGWAVKDTPTGQYEVPFEIVSEETTGLPVLLLKRNVDARPEDAVDDADDCVYASLLQLHLDGWTFAHTGMRKRTVR